MEDTTIENALKTFEEYYLKKDYPNAILTLEKNQKEIDPSIWHYDMGTVLAEMKNWPMARLHFILAERSGMDSKELHQNLELVENILEIPRLEKPLDPSDYLIKAGMIASQGPLLSLSLIFLIIGLWLIKKSPSLKSAMIFLGSVSFPIILNFWIDSWPKKIAINSIIIFEGPSALFEARGELPPGLLLITNVKGDWEQIIYPSRFSGWIKSQGLKRLELK